MKFWIIAAFVTAALFTSGSTQACEEHEKDSHEFRFGDQEGVVRVLRIESEGEGESAQMEITVEVEDGGAWLGVQPVDIDDETAADAGLDERRGALLLTVFDNTPAARGGLEAGDVVTSFGGKKVADAADLVRLVGEAEVGDKVRVRVRRDGHTKTVRVTLGERDDVNTINLSKGDGNCRTLPNWAMDTSLDLKDHLLMSLPGGKTLGVRVRDLDPDLGAYFPGYVGKGTLVLGVEDDSAAEAAGILSGDVIISFAETEIEGSKHLTQVVQGAVSETPLALVVLRHGKLVELSATLAPSLGEKAERKVKVLRRIIDDGGHEVGEIRDRVEEKLRELDERIKELEKRK